MLGCESVRAWASICRCMEGGMHMYVCVCMHASVWGSGVSLHIYMCMSVSLCMCLLTSACVCGSVYNHAHVYMLVNASEGLRLCLGGMCMVKEDCVETCMLWHGDCACFLYLCFPVHV